jgi:hypothetical protein
MYFIQTGVSPTYLSVMECRSESWRLVEYIKKSTAAHGEYKNPIWSTSESYVQYINMGVQENVAIEDGGSWFLLKKGPSSCAIEKRIV